jgi:alkylation response protein AidB-like acyl-CoA dehydrogenase
VTLAGEDLELFARSLDHAVSSATGADLDAALLDLGWFDALDDDRQAAVSLLFELQGRHGATSSALDAVLASAAGLPRGTRVVLPGFGDGVVIGPGSDGTGALVDGFDPALGLRRVDGPAPALAPEAVAAGRLALAHELVGVSRTMLELARMHALERVQFDRPIAQFQAVRHKLAETLVAIEAANDAAGAAWELDSLLASSAAKAIAGRAARTAARHCQQVLAGIGFTTEHPFHRSMRRALVLDRLMGDARSLTREMGEELLRTRRVPPMLAL